MKKAFSIILCIAIILSSISMISFSVNATEAQAVSASKTGRGILLTEGVESDYAFARVNLGVKELVDGNHKVIYTFYNPNNYAIQINFYVQYDWKSVSSKGTTAVMPANSKTVFVANYSVKNGFVDGKAEWNDPAKLYVRIDLYNEKGGNGAIPAGTKVYVEYNESPETDIMSKFKSLQYYAASKNASTYGEYTLPDYEYDYHQVVNGDVESGTTGWSTFTGGGCARSSDTKTGSGYSMQLTKAANKHDTLTFAVQAAVIDDDNALLNGNGAGSYVITFDAKASADFVTAVTLGTKEHKTADQIAGLIGGSASDYVSTWISASGAVTFTTQWQTYSVVINVPQKLLNTYKALWMAGYDNAYKLDLRFNASAAGYANEQTTTYCIDNVSIAPYEPESVTGAVYEVKSNVVNPWLKTSDGILTNSNIVDGYLVYEGYIFNESDTELFFTPALQTTADGKWSGYSGESVEVERHSGAWITVKAPVGDDNKIAVGSGTFTADKFFLRLSFSTALEAGIKFVLNSNESISSRMIAISSMDSSFKASATTDKKYKNIPEKPVIAPVDPDFHVSGAFTSNMVLQRDSLVPVWGVSTYIGNTVTVAFGNQVKTATVGSDGTWSVTLDKMSANKAPQEMTASCNGKTQTLSNILVGDVYLVGGQSNAEKTLASCGSAYSNEYKASLIASAEGNIRFFRQGKADASANPTTMNSPQAEPINNNVWKVETNLTAGTFSAVGFFFAHRVYEAANVPIGMVMVASAGSPVSQLMSKEASEKTGYDRYENNIPVSGMYNALMNPFIKMSFKAMLYYQGESENGLALNDYGKYNEYVNAYVEDLREKNGNDFPFYYVQLSSHVTDQWSGIAEQRAVQFDGLKVIKNSGMVVSMDHGFRSTDSDFAHPNYKKPVGDRLGDLALARLYGIYQENMVTSPVPVYAVQTDEGILVTFKNVANGLKRIGQHETLSGFKAITSSGYVSVAAEIVSDTTVLVRSNGINGVTGVAYGMELLAFADYPEGGGDLKYVANLGNSADLPAPTFKMYLDNGIIGATVDMGVDLTVNLHASVNGSMVFTHNGKTVTVEGVYNEAYGCYTYSYCGITPQCIGDKLSAALYVGGVKIDERADYSIKEYCDNIVSRGYAEGYDSDKFESLKQFMADMLDYGAAAQEYRDYKTDTPVNSLDWVADNRSAFTVPASVRSINTTLKEGYFFKAAGLHIDNNISLYVRVQAVSMDNVTIKATAGGITTVYTADDLMGDVLYLDDLGIGNLDKVYTVELCCNGETVQTLTYSANSYIAQKYEGAIADLVRAIARCGASAKEIL